MRNTLYLTMFFLLHRAFASVADAQCTANAGPDKTLNCVTPTVILEGSSNVPDAVYNWSGPNNFTSNAQSPEVNLPGNYELTIIDTVNSCSAFDIVTVIVVQSQQYFFSSSITNPIDDFQNGAIVLTSFPPTLDELDYAWTGPNGFTANTAEIYGLGPGTYNVIITDLTAGCTYTLQFSLVAIYLPFTPTTTICQGPLIYEQDDFPAGYSISIDNVPYIFGTPLNLTPGTHQLVIIDNFGTGHPAILIVPLTSEPCIFTEGYVKFDSSTDCVPDSLEPGISGWNLQATGPDGIFYAVTDSSGYYRLGAPPGSYTLSLISKDPTAILCNNNIPIDLNANDSLRIDFAVQVPDPDCARLSVDLSISSLRRCFANNCFVKCCNNGPSTVSGPWVTVQLDPLLILTAAQHPYIDLGGGLYRFNLNDLPAYTCDNFGITLLVDCDAVLGQALCAEAHIFPDTLCEVPNPEWTGALLNISSRCEGDSLVFIITNTGTGSMGQSQDYIVIEDGSLGFQGLIPVLGPGDSLVIKVPANGATWRFETAQVPYAPPSYWPMLSVEGCSGTNSFSTGFLNQFPQGGNAPWISTDCRTVSGSYDPNDKQGFPTGYGPQHYIRPGTELEYMVRFQNTGTDTAFTVVIRDTLSPWLDPLTIRPGASSHPYRFQLAGEGVLIFDFENILLPDSNVNEAASHGFVQFRIAPRADVPLETDIHNSAAIYFDFNDPVLTNTTTHRIGENFVTLSLWQPKQPLYAVHVAPHPLQDASWIRLEGVAASGHYLLQLFDITGRPLRRLEADTPAFLLRRGDLPEGMYTFRIEESGVLLGSGKLLVR